MENSDMKQCHGFLHSWQDTELIPCTEYLDNEISEHHMLDFRTTA